MKSAGADFHIQRLGNDAAFFGPVVLQSKNQTLKGFYVGSVHVSFRRGAWSN